MRKQQGVSLILVVIIAFTLISIATMTAYHIRMDSLASKSLAKGLDSQSTARDYVETFLESKDIEAEASSSGSSMVVDGIRHEVSASKELELDDPNVHQLTNARAGFSSNVEMAIYKLSHSMFENDINKKLLSEEIFVVAAQNFGRSFYRSVGYTIAPINVPYIDGLDLSSLQMNAAGSHEKMPLGYAGAMQIDTSDSNVKLYGFDGSYKTMPSIGGYGVPHRVYATAILRDGVWCAVFLQVFSDTLQSDADVIFASETTIDNLSSDLDQAYADLTGAYAKIELNALADDIVLYDSQQGTRLFVRKDFIDESGAEQHLKEVYEYGIDATTDTPFFTQVNSAEFDDETKRNGYLIHTVAMVKPNTHNVHDVIIMTDTEEPNRNVVIDGVNYGIVYKKNYYAPEIGYADANYILATMDNSSVKFYKYDQTAANSANALQLLETLTGVFGTGADPEKIIIQYGYYFVISTKKIYVYNADYIKVDEVDITSSTDIEILYDDLLGQLYALPNALVCRLDNSCSNDDRVYLDVFIPKSMMRSRIFYSRIV